MERGRGFFRGRGPPPVTLASRKAEREARSAASSSGYGRGRRPLDEEEPAQRPPPVILKPPRPALEENDEEWPTISSSMVVPRSRTNSPASKEGSEPRPARPPIIKTQLEKPATKSVQSLFARKKTIPAEDIAERRLKAGIQMIGDNLEWTELPLEYLTDQTEFLVVGVMGPQGVGKSTLLSMIGGNDAFDMYRQYIFRPASREASESCKHQTSGVQFYVTPSRVILLDSQASMSPSIMDEMMRLDRRYSFEYKTMENFVEIESLQLAAFMLQICHVVLVVSDWFLDLNLVRFVRCAEMLKPTLPLNEYASFVDHFPNIVVIHQKAKLEDFQVETIRKRCRLLERLFAKSQLKLKCSVSLAKSSFPQFAEGLENEKDISYFPLSDMKLRGHKSDRVTETQKFKFVPDYEALIKDLRLLIRSVPRPPFTPSHPFSEKQWFHFASRMWDGVRKSHLVAEFGRTLT